MDALLIKPVENEKELKEALAIRTSVFGEEQGISKELDQDGNDASAFLVIAKNGSLPVATARVRFPDKHQAKLERMAVIKPSRSTGIGREVVSFLEQELKKRGIRRIVLHAQYPVIDFYQKCGFEAVGSPFFEAAIKHIRMEKTI